MNKTQTEISLTKRCKSLGAIYIKREGNKLQQILDVFTRL